MPPDRRGTTQQWGALDPDSIATMLADAVDELPGVVRVAVDGPPCTGPEALADELIEQLRVRGRPGAHIRSAAFWRDRSLRYEYGREDVESYRCWLDADALRREVLDAVVSSGTYLPSLRDPDTNRSTHASAIQAGDSTVIVVSGPLLLGRNLPFDRAVHLLASSAARGRRTPPDEAWTLPAFDEYDATVRPGQVADVVIKVDDPRHPAARGL